MKCIQSDHSILGLSVQGLHVVSHIISGVKLKFVGDTVEPFNTDTLGLLN